MEYLIEYMIRGIMIMLVISMPCVLVAALIGLVVGILQAVTQVQEQTIAAAPKILGVFLAIVIGAYGYVQMLTNFTLDGFALAFNVVPKNDTYVLPADYYRYTHPFAGEMKDVIKNKTDLKDLMQGATRRDLSKFGGEKMKYIPASQVESVKPNIVEQKKIMGR